MKKISELNTKYQLLINIAISILVGFLLIFTCAGYTSILYQQSSLAAYYNDSATFCIMGDYMVRGYTPYVDIFDHKGLYIFYYTALYHFLGKFGVFLIQWLVVSFAICFIAKTIRLFSEDIRLIIFGIMIFFIAYAFTGQTPNDVDLEIPFYTLMIYFYLRGIKDNDYKLLMFGNIFAGIGAGIALNLRVSDALLPLSFVIFYFVKIIKDKQKIIYLFRDAGIVLGGIILMTLPCLLHAYLGGFLNEMINSVYISNFKYVSTNSDRSDGVPIVAILGTIIVYAIYVTLIIFKRKEIPLDLILFILVSAGVSFIIEIIIAYYPFYLIVLYSYLAISIPVLMSYYNIKNIVKNIIVAASSALFIGSLVFNPITVFSNKAVDTNNLNYLNETVPEESKDKHSIIFGTPALYLMCDVTIGYGDFTSQHNHILISETYSKERLLSFLDSGDCHYIICSNSTKKFVNSLMSELTSTYTYIDTSLEVTINVYKHNII